jgi:hypothetical protein
VNCDGCVAGPERGCGTPVGPECDCGIPVGPECDCGVSVCGAGDDVGPDCGNESSVDECGDGVGTMFAGGFAAGAFAGGGLPRFVAIRFAGAPDGPGRVGPPRAVGASSGGSPGRGPGAAPRLVAIKSAGAPVRPASPVADGRVAPGPRAVGASSGTMTAAGFTGGACVVGWARGVNGTGAPRVGGGSERREARSAGPAGWPAPVGGVPAGGGPPCPGGSSSVDMRAS